MRKIFTTLAVAAGALIPSVAVAQLSSPVNVVVGTPDQSLLDARKEGAQLLFVNPDGSPAAAASQAVRAPQRATDEVYTPPFSNSFETAADLNLFTIIDANRDSKKWEWNSQKFVALMNNAWQAANDFLVTPGIQLKAGYLYTFTVQARPYRSEFPEKIALWAGTAPTVEGLSTCIMEPLTIEEEKWLPFSGNFLAETDGVYYFAVQGCSDADMYALLVNSVEVGAGLNTKAPGAPEITATRDAGGKREAALKVVAPRLDIAGGQVSRMSSLKVYRDGELLKSFDNPKAGMIYSFYDKNLTAANHTWKAVAENAEGEGLAATATCFTGVYFAQWPSVVNITTGENEGQVELNWPASSLDQNGNPLPADSVTYEIYRIHGGSVGMVASGLTEPKYVEQVCQADDPMRDVQYTVMARTSYGLSAGTGTGIFYVGAPYELPFDETFANGELSHLWFSRGMANYAASWELANMDDYEEEVPPTDADDTAGFAYHRAYRVGETALIGTAKISIPDDLKEATLLFSTYHFAPGDLNTLEVTIDDNKGNISEPEEFPQAGTPAWVDYEVDLLPYQGKTIKVIFTNKVATHILTTLDNVHITAVPNESGIEAVDADAVEAADAPAEYFNLQGIRLQEAPAAGAYIERRGTVVTKRVAR